MQEDNLDREIRILMVEDSPTDAELTERELRKGELSFVSKCVETKDSFLKELEDFSPDIILADYSLPQFDGLSALSIVKERYPDIPFILISGTIGEEVAVEALKAGAIDYILKQRLSRLVHAVRRALSDAEEMIKRKQAENRLIESEKKYKDLVDNALLVGVYQTNIKGNILYANEALASIFEFESIEEMMSVSMFERYKNPDDKEVLIEKLKKTGKVTNFEVELLTKTGKTVTVLLSATLEGEVISGMMRDITKRKIAEEQVQYQLQRLTALRNIDMAITASLDVRVTLNVFLDQVTNVLRIDAATVLLLNPNTLNLEYAASRGSAPVHSSTPTCAWEKGMPAALRLNNGLLASLIWPKHWTVSVALHCWLTKGLFPTTPCHLLQKAK